MRQKRVEVSQMEHTVMAGDALKGGDSTEAVLVGRRRRLSCLTLDCS